MSVVAAVVVLSMPGAVADPGSAPRRACALDSIAWGDPARFALPGGLREVSGLTVLDGTRLLAHDDERGIVSLLDTKTGERVGRFSLGPRLPRADFEGIARLGDVLYLSTSAGQLYETTIGRDGGDVAYRVLETGLGRLCEMEGLAADPATRSLLLSCKSPRTTELRGRVSVFAWSVERGALESVRFRAPEAEMRVKRRGSFRPSAIEILPGGDLLLLSGADRAIALVSPPDLVRCVRDLDSRHHQAEGLALMPDGSLAVADEGSPGRLTVYPRTKP